MIDSDLKTYDHLSDWVTFIDHDTQLIRILVQSQDSDLEGWLKEKHLNALLFPVQTALPSPSPEVQSEKDEADEEELARVSRQELYAVAESTGHISKEGSVVGFSVIGVLKNSPEIVRSDGDRPFAQPDDRSLLCRRIGRYSALFPADGHHLV